MDKLNQVLDITDVLDEKMHILVETDVLSSETIKALSEVEKVSHPMYELMLSEMSSRAQGDRLLATTIQRVNGISKSIANDIHNIRTQHDIKNKENEKRFEELEKLHKRDKIKNWLIYGLIILCVSVIFHYNPEIFKTILMFLHSLGNIFS